MIDGAGRGVARRVVVRDDEGRSVQLQRSPKDYPRLQDGLASGAGGNNLVLQQPVAGVEVKRAHLFIGPVRHRGVEIAEKGLAGREHRTGHDIFSQDMGNRLAHHRKEVGSGAVAKQSPAIVACRRQCSGEGPELGDQTTGPGFGLSRIQRAEERDQEGSAAPVAILFRWRQVPNATSSSIG